MKHLFIPYELAVIAKEKGFDETCLGYYDSKFKELNIVGKYPYDTAPIHVIAPTFQQIIDWFRECKKIYIQLQHWGLMKKNNPYYFILTTRYEEISGNMSNSYYEAMIEAITEAFKLI